MVKLNGDIMRGLYIHIPFCKHICSYCDFPKRIAANEHQIDKYIDFIIEDIDNYKKYFPSIKTIYIGGGTPNFLSDYNLKRLLEKIDSLNLSPLEYTIECNPEFISLNQIELFKKYGINRVSLGVESFFDSDLEFLNRHHTKADAIKAIQLLRSNGITNINIDLIFAHPNDTLEKIKCSLDEFLKLDLPHISYYNMILEEKTIFSNMLSKGEIKLLDNDIEASMYELIIDTLKKNGYHHYETSNFAKPGFESIHNQLYWDSLEYIGIGAGASGYLDSIRYTNDAKIKSYYLNEKEEEVISLKEKKKEYFLLGFRKIDGVSILEYKKRFNSNPLDDFDFNLLKEKCLVFIDDDKIKLTKKGIMLTNEVFMEFV